MTLRSEDSGDRLLQTSTSPVRAMKAQVGQGGARAAGANPAALQAALKGVDLTLTSGKRAEPDVSAVGAKLA